MIKATCIVERYLNGYLGRSSTGKVVFGNDRGEVMSMLITETYGAES